MYAREDYNYAPVASCLFVLVGHLQRDIFDRPFATDSSAMRAAIKLPAILADLAITATLYLFLARRATRIVAIAGALAYALNPAIVYDSVVWGQWDSLVALPMLLATICLIVARPRLAAVCLATAVLTKFQAVVLGPVVVVVIFRQFGWRGLLNAALAGVATAAVLVTPVIAAGQLRPAFDVYVGLTHAQPWVSNNAYNTWWLVNWFQSGSPTMTLKDQTALLGPIDYKAVALSVFALALAGIMLAVWRARLSVATISLASAASVIAFFALAPEMHERYLVPALPLLILGFESRVNRWLLGVLTVTVYVSLDWVLVSAEGARWSALKLAATGMLAVVNLSVLIWAGIELDRHGADRDIIRRPAWLVGAMALLAVAAFAGFTIGRWYIRDVRG